MGQAKRRGSTEDRINQAIKREALARIEEGGLVENNMNYCHKCGGTIRQALEE